jgi:hypothetical protein
MCIIVIKMKDGSIKYVGPFSSEAIAKRWFKLFDNAKTFTWTVEELNTPGGINGGSL